jgi:hypothetical protein
MMRGYSMKTVQRIKQLQATTLSVELAQACVSANLPISEIAILFDVTRATVASWFKNGPIRGDSKKGLAIKMIEAIERDKEEGLLPAKNREEGIEYLRNMKLS